MKIIFNGEPEDGPKEIQFGDLSSYTTERIKEDFDQFESSAQVLRFRIMTINNKHKTDGVKQTLVENLRRFTSVKRIIIELQNVYILPSQIKVLIDSIVEECPYLEELEVSFQRTKINKAFVDTLFDKIGSFQFLRRVKLDLSQYSSNVPKILAGHLQSIKNLRSLCYKAAETPSASSVEFFTELAKIQTLVDLNLNYNYNAINKDASKALGNMISSLPNMQNLVLTIQKSNINKEALQIICDGFAQSASLQNLEFDMSFNSFKSDELIPFAQGLKKLNRLKSFKMIQNTQEYDHKALNALVEGFSHMVGIETFKFLNDFPLIYFGQQKPLGFFDMQLFCNVLKNLINLRSLEIIVMAQSFIPILINLKQCKFLTDLTLRIELSTEPNALQDYSEKQLQESLKNLEHIADIKLQFTFQRGDVNQRLVSEIVKLIPKLQNTTNLTISFAVETFVSHLLVDCQNQFLDQLSYLKNTLNNLSLNIFFVNLTKQRVNELSKMRNLYTLQVYQERFYNIDKKVMSAIKKSTKLVQYSHAFV